MCCFVERAVPSVMALFRSAPAQTLSPTAPLKRRIQRAALTTAPKKMMMKRRIAGSGPTKPAGATTIPRNTATLNSNTPSLCRDVSCACHYKGNQGVRKRGTDMNHR